MKLNKQLIPYGFYLSIVLLITAFAVFGSYLMPFEHSQTVSMFIIDRAPPETARFAPEKLTFPHSDTYSLIRSEELNETTQVQTNISGEQHITSSTRAQNLEAISHYTRLDLPFSGENTYGFIDSNGTLQIRILENNGAGNTMTVKKGRLVQFNNLISVLPSDSPASFDPSQDDFGHITPEPCKDLSCLSFYPVFGHTGLYYSQDGSKRPTYYLYGKYPDSQATFYRCDSYSNFIEGSLPVILN